MKNVSLTFILLLLSVVLIACNNVSKELEEIEDVNQVAMPENTQELDSTILDHDKEKNSLPTFQSIAAPSISLISPTGEVISPSFDHSYGEVCWNDCSELYHYNYPTIHGSEVEAGNQLLIDWSMVNPQPTEVHFIRIDNSDEYDLKELSKEQKTSEHASLKISIDEVKAGNQFALEFIWKDGASVKGKSIMNFKIE